MATPEEASQIQHTLGIQASDKSEGIVGEESFVVKSVANKLSCRSHAHGLLVIVLIIHISSLDDLFEGRCICLKACCSDDDLRRAARQEEGFQMSKQAAAMGK